MNFQVQPTEKKRPLWPYLLIGTAVVVLLVVLFGWTGRQPARKGQAEVRLPFGSAEQAYAPNVKFEKLKMSRFANFLNQEVTYLDGEIVNQGNRTIARLQVTLEFRNARNQVVLRQTRSVFGARSAVIGPGASRAFRLGFEQIPDDWNMQYPSLKVTGLVLR